VFRHLSALANPSRLAIENVSRPPISVLHAIALITALATTIPASAFNTASAQTATPLPSSSSETEAPVAQPRPAPTGTTQPMQPPGRGRPIKPDGPILLTAGQCRGLGGVAIKTDVFVSRQGKTCHGVCSTVDPEGVIRSVCITEAFSK